MEIDLQDSTSQQGGVSSKLPAFPEDPSIQRLEEEGKDFRFSREKHT